MEIIGISILLVLGLYFYSSYKTFTIRMSLQKRDEMISLVNEILNDQDSPADLKKAAIGIFHASVMPRAFLKIIWFNFKERKNMSKYQLNIPDRFKDKLKQLNDYFFKINVLSAPHIYFMLLLLVLVLFLVALFILLCQKGYKYLNVISGLTNPASTMMFKH